jgi:hypothetical protein
MKSDYYEKKTARGILTLRLIGGHWELRLYTEPNPELYGKVIRSDYVDPDQAALDASRGDFGISEFDDLFQGVYVPSDLQKWRNFQSPFPYIQRDN